MTYEEAIGRISSLLRFGMKPGLERITKLLDMLGNPQKKLKFIHVAGTNGKGSASSLLSSVLKNAGYCTGLYLSPYLVDFRERMQVNGTMIPKEELASLVECTFPLIREMAEQGEEITEFEFITALAMQWYVKCGCDIVVLEVGLGGRFDATNVIDCPLVSVIMAISLDHTAILGDTVEQIAFEKCGIVKPGGQTVLFEDQPGDVLSVVQDICKQRNNRLIVAKSQELSVLSANLSETRLAYRGMTLHLPLLGAHQVKNAAVVLQVLDCLKEKGYRILLGAIEAGFRQIRFPARLELLSREPVFLLDGAHNPNGMQMLAEAIRSYLPGRRTVCIMGMLKDKDSISAIRYLDGLFCHVITLTPDNPRALDAKELAHRWQQHCPSISVGASAGQAVQQAIEMAGKDGAVVVCGSLYLAAEVRPEAIRYFEKE